MPVDVAHVRRVEEFRATLHTPAEVIVDQQILTSGCFALGPDFDEGMREEVAQHFGITPDDVLVVGSGKLGFSISKKWQGGMVIRERYRPFTDNSDLDVAIIAPVLFDLIWEQAFVHMNDLGPWAEVRSFEKYFFRGWLRPDKLPTTFHSSQLRDMRTFFGRMSRDRDYCDNRINVGVYRTKLFLRTYQTVAVKECQQEQGLTL